MKVIRGNLKHKLSLKAVTEKLFGHVGEFWVGRVRSMA
jgi:hypothetical protein